ncbi:DJ-1 protein-PfpI domain-containing protein [Favolaschia claudopus]|uniref:DJ-1 protein-PfpI domain-containing protein n=1 Tax=Favolaschia claudopus TaxID=2862362 RepID=A0AAW0B7S6_9AGAR
MPQTLNIAVCIYPGVTLSDFIPCVEVLSGLNYADHPVFGPAMGGVPYRATFDYIAPTMEPVVSANGNNSPTINPTTTYAKAVAGEKQYDIFWIPAGPVPDEKGNVALPDGLKEFLTERGPKAKYICSVCAGSLILAVVGLLSGKKATTNKAFYRAIVAASPKDIEWVPKARWVVDGNLWTSSGVSAGTDMAIAFLEHLAGERAAKFTRGFIEIREAPQDDDPFAEVHGLV